MKRRFLMVSAVVIVLGVGMIGVAGAQDEDGPMSDLRFVVVRDYNGKPVRNAAVVLHPVNRKGKQARGGLELKTDGEGRGEDWGVSVGARGGGGGRGGRTLTGFRMVRCGCRCWRRVSRLLGKTTRSTKRRRRLR